MRDLTIIFMLAEHLPLQQGLRLDSRDSSVSLPSTRRASSITTRIKTLRILHFLHWRGTFSQTIFHYNKDFVRSNDRFGFNYNNVLWWAGEDVFFVRNAFSRPDFLPFFASFGSDESFFFRPIGLQMPKYAYFYKVKNQIKNPINQTCNQQPTYNYSSFRVKAHGWNPKFVCRQKFANLRSVSKVQLRELHFFYAEFSQDCIFFMQLFWLINLDT